MKDLIRNRVDLCVELVDAFTNRIVGPVEAQVQINGRPPAMKKDERFFIFQKIEGDNIEITVQAEAYESIDCSISYGELQERAKGVLQGQAGYAGFTGVFLHMESGIGVILLRLHPGEDYVLPVGFVRKQIEGAPGEEICVVKNPNAPMFLMEDYEGGRLLSIKAEDGMAGRRYHIEGKNGLQEEFTVTGQWGENQVMAETELHGRYEKGSRLHELYCAKADEEGKATVVCRECE